MRLPQAKRRRLFWAGILVLLGLGICIQARAETQPMAPAGNEAIFVQSMDLTRVDVLLDDIAQLAGVARTEDSVGTDSGAEQLAGHFARTRANFLLLRASACQKGVTEACSPLGQIAGMEQLRNAVEPLWSMLCARAPANIDRTLCQTE